MVARDHNDLRRLQDRAGENDGSDKISEHVKTR